MPWPEVYCIVKVKRCRWSKVDGPRSAARLSQFCATDGLFEFGVVTGAFSAADRRVGVPPPAPFKLAPPVVRPAPLNAAASSMDFEYVYWSVAVRPLLRRRRNWI